MFGDQHVLAIIPARRGSRGIPMKNTIDLAGRPLIQWTIDAASHSSHIDQILLSTDDSKAMEIAASQGIEVLQRPADLADDNATAAQVIAHVIAVTGVTGIVTYLQPTSPLRSASDIDECIKLLENSQAEGVVTVTEVTQHPEWMFRINESNKILDSVLKGDTPSRRQKLPKAVRINGAVYCARAESLRRDGDIFRLTIAGYEMPYSRSLDIDDFAHLAEAERLLRLD